MSVRAKKHLGQHFLNDLNVAQKIVESLSWQGYEQVLEIGPGMGVLTQFLIEKNQNIQVVEIDEESVQFLNKKYNLTQERLKIYSEDFLKMNLSANFNAPLAILGNFPYNISSQILFKILENKNIVPEMVGMFQKEVAERVVATHGSKTYGILSVLVQAYYDVEYLFTVDEHVFSPPPKVKSAVIRLTRNDTKFEILNEKYFFTLVKTAFNQRRKTLRNALKSLNYSVDFKISEVLNLRAEQLSVVDFIDLSNVFASSDS
ncbi:16S rRNA (adenine(1518)-N(6)/adenine(1519)-N(6))-dimethyltransferase RsmA [Candidatus Ornithobacterium hominis]|uniref:16S rRNA (adenine(1518)-N(6)/adenine(1519)-N(6))- dimethyltransferase RsmA n=1 Tax=Candidatus Ornithobacterium hominis TaxID=2497989 RepID=UPI0024BD1096|nr:16S rRNA (adenine(1518)-N(6)/adenine(1519)-N(6))-dimethyltransferase RsmA [Candidatus Ornithobacterium hominis]CAI9429545.1 16S rRNA (adenine(1518)-N(6)/adenine(1519)-N(6))-dimethyltransferase RsmA [Candidatus Ornithobacterium hominis]